MDDLKNTDEGKYRRFFEYSNDIIVEVDKFGKVLNVNNRLEEIFGFKPEDVIGKYFFNLGILGIRELPMIVDLFKKTIREGMNKDKAGRFLDKVELELRAKSGNLIFVETSTTILKKDGKIEGFLTSVRDITESKRAKDRLKASEEKYRDLFENANDAICILDSDLNYREVNNKAMELFGYSKEEMLQMNVIDIIPHDQIPISKIEFNKLRKKGSYEKFVGKACTKDGRLIDVEVSSSVIKDGEKIVGSRDIIRDITERKQWEDALMESRKNLQEAQHLAHIGSWHWTMATDKVKWSNELYHINGYDPDSSAPGYKEMSSFYTTQSWKKLNEVVGKALQRGEPYDLDLEMIRSDGTLINTSTRGEADYDTSGKIIGLHGTVQDITERKRAEDMIKESETRLQSILDNSSTVVFLKDILGRYITVNRRFEELFHVNRRDIVNKTDYDIFPQEFADKFRHHDDQAVEKLKAIETEEVVPHDDGLHTYISVKFPLVSQSGKPYAVCGIATDITERKKSQEQIERSLKEKEILLRELYHRVKNNMQIITSLLSLQSRYARDKEDLEMFRDCHDRIKSMSLVHEKLYQSKDLTTIDFKEYIKDIAKGLFQSFGADKNKISLVMEVNNISLDINAAIPCGLIINELLTNSLKHAFPEGEKGEIKISIQSLNEKTIELVVGDNGKGIPEDVDLRTTKSLGLQLVAMLAENQLHGEILLDRNNGTEFTITFKEVK
ncbi:MAG: PAS domain S-box protein [Candidatus Methanoperedens sp.]|nr:PAS domain S-box protein [Candidatus Methanoperedens sp.]